MAYVPNATTVTEPVDTRKASTAALEFRTLKAYIQSVIVPATGDKLPLAGGIMSGDILFSDSDFRINANTADATDDKRIVISGGGGFSDTRGANLLLAGNEHASQPGQANLYAGSTGSILLSAATTQITAAVMTWSGNPTHSGDHTWSSTQRFGTATTNLQLSSGSGIIRNHTTGSVLDMQVVPADGTGDATVRFHRSTNTTGTVSVQFLRGNNSVTADHIFVSGASAVSELGINGGKVNVGNLTNAPAFSTTDILRVGGSTATSNSGVQINAGANTALSYLHFGDPDARDSGGFQYNHNTDTLVVRAGGAPRVTLSSLLLAITPNTSIGGTLDVSGAVDLDSTLAVTGTATISGAVRGASGSAATPEYSFVSSTDMGMYRSSSTVLGFSVAGAVAMSLQSDGDMVVTGLVYGRNGGAGLGQITVSTATPSGGANGDIWFQY